MKGDTQSETTDMKLVNAVNTNVEMPVPVEVKGTTDISELPSEASAKSNIEEEKHGNNDYTSEAIPDDNKTETDVKNDVVSQKLQQKRAIIKP